MGVIDPGIGDVAAAGITAGANITSTELTNQANKDIAEANNKLQSEMFYEGQEFNAREAEKAYQRDIDKMKMEQEYNSPLEQVKRYQEAGINPAVAMSGQGGTSGNVTSPTGAPSATTPNIPLLTSPHMQSVDFTPIAQVYKTMVEAKKAGIESTQLEKSFDKVLSNMDLDIESKELNNLLTRVYGPALQNSMVRKNLASARESLAAAYNFRESGKTEESKRALNDSLRLMNDSLSAFYGEEKKYKELEVKSFFDVLNKKFQEIDSNIAKNRSEAALISEQASQLQDMRAFIINEKKWTSRNAENLYKLDSAEVQEKYATLNHYLSYINEHYDQLKQQDKLLVRELEEKLRYLEHTNDWRVYHEVLDGLERTANAVSGFIPLAPERTSSNSSQTIVDPKGGVTTIETENFSSRRKGR